jgi:hypothetical protein
VGVTGQGVKTWFSILSGVFAGWFELFFSTDIVVGGGVGGRAGARKRQLFKSVFRHTARR